MNSKERRKDLSQRKVVEHNDLISSVAKMNRVPLKMFELAVSAIDTNKPPKDNTVYISKKEVFAFFNVSDTNMFSRFKKAIETMQRQAYFEVREVKEKGFKYRNIVPIPYVEWNDYDDRVTVRFDQAIMPYLINLKQNFTQYVITDIMDLHSKYSIVIYRWLNMQYNQYEYYRNNGGRTQEQLDELRNPVISIDDLRTLTDTKDEYQLMSHFTKNILERPIKEINEHTHFHIAYKKIKEGRRIVKVKFSIAKASVAPLDYKSQENARKTAEERKKQENELYVKAMSSQYTKMLSDEFLLGPADMMNRKGMVYLQERVYPKYDKISQLRGGGKDGEDALLEHFKYVKTHAIPAESEKQYNMPRYLGKAADNYLEHLRFEER